MPPETPIEIDSETPAANSAANNNRENLSASGSLWGSAWVRLALVTGLALLVTAPLAIHGSELGLKSMFNAPLLWIDHDAPARKQFNEFLELFGTHEMVVVTWPGCTVDDQRLDRAGERLRETHRELVAAGEAPLFTHVLTGNTMLDELRAAPIDLSRKAAINRLTGVLVGHDGKTSCLVVELTATGGMERKQSIPLIRDTVSQAVNLPPEELIVSGPAVDGLAIDYESMQSIDRFSLPSVFISMLLCWACLRSFSLTIPIVIIGAWAQGLMLASIYYSGITMNAILIVLPALVFVLTVSAGVHLAHYFLEEVEKGVTDHAPLRAVQKATVPCLLAAITTAIGLASLCISEVEPVRQFGLLGAIGIVICVALLFMFVPGFMEIWLRLAGRRASRSQTVTSKESTESSKPTMSARAANATLRWGLLIRWGCIIAMIGCGYGLTKLQTSVDVVSLLSEENRVVKDFHWIEDNISPLVPIEVIVRFDQDSNVEPLDRLRVVAAVQGTIDQIELIEGTMSAVTFMPPLPSSVGLGKTVRRNVFLSQLEQGREELIEANYLAEVDGGEAWRISARMPGNAQFKHAEFLQKMQTQVDALLAKAAEEGYTGISSSSTGVLVLSFRIQEMLLADLFKSFLAALGLVAIVMIIALRSVLGGLMAMLPNIFPTIILFGAMGWMNRSIDIGTVMTASVALGIAVDGTFHFLKWFALAVKQGRSQKEAIEVAYRHCAGALIQATIICGCGLLIYSFSGFMPVRNFSFVLLMLLFVALFGDLVLLPALLAGRLGRALMRGQAAVV
jgi:predicted RND superfamily exporter protein